MAINNRIMTSFAMEDVRLRDFLIQQARDERSPFSFVDMSVKEPWDSEWKTKCRSRIKSCDGVIGIITSNTRTASGQLWELKCAIEERVPVFLMYGYADQKPLLDHPFSTHPIYAWSWANISAYLNRL